MVVFMVSMCVSYTLGFIFCLSDVTYQHLRKTKALFETDHATIAQSSLLFVFKINVNEFHTGYEG